MIALFISTLLCIFLLTTFGTFWAKLFKLPSTLVENLLIGLVVCNTITSYVSLLFPINIFTSLVLLGVGCVLYIFIAGDLKQLIASEFRQRYIVFYAIPFLLVAFLLSVSSPSNYDSELYHIQSLKWIGQFPAVPGLANLHGRFGFNPNVFTFFALLSNQELFSQAMFPVNFTVFIIVALYFIKTMSTLLERHGLSKEFLFYILLFLFFLALPNLSSPSPDFLSTTIVLFIFLRFIDLSRIEADSNFLYYVPILILSLYVTTVKLSSIPVLLLSFFVIIKFRPDFRKSYFLFLSCIIIMLPWLARNVITTGWLVYPFPALDLFNFDWKVPLAEVIVEKEAITGWARNPGTNYIASADMLFEDWFPLWWQRLSFNNKLLFTGSIVFPILFFTSQLIGKVKIDQFTNAAIFTSFCGVIFWTFLAPDWRFGESFILVASLSPLLAFKRSRTTANETKVVLGILMLLTFCIYIKENYPEIRSNSLKALTSSLILVPRKVKDSTSANFNRYSINSIDFYQPTEDDRCFDHEIPCTPHLKTNLVLRKKTLRSGFRDIGNNE
jgi:hypothetical protein